MTALDDFSYEDEPASTPAVDDRLPALELLQRRLALFENDHRRLCSVIQRAVADLESGAPREAVVLDLAGSLEPW